MEMSQHAVGESDSSPIQTGEVPLKSLQPFTLAPLHAGLGFAGGTGR